MSAGIAIAAWSPMLSDIEAVAGIAGTATGVSNNPASASAARTKRRADNRFTLPPYYKLRSFETVSELTMAGNGRIRGNE
jgi:hypothetical protein